METASRDWRTAIPSENADRRVLDEFVQRTKNASTEVHRVHGIKESIKIILDIANGMKAKTVVAVPGTLLDESGLIEDLKHAGLQVFTSKEDIASHVDTADIGISEVEFGIAESGSVCQHATEAVSRLVSSLPPVHVAFMKSERIVTGIQDAIDILSKGFDSGYVSWLTGPSRTADIERVLTIGVHGPSRFILILVDEAGGKGVQ
ncbi:MAG: lactate utilization protein [Deltaproteobacteria bacterium]|nr:lactate utilization protein [Deltaproteobacteria bacterium]